MRWPRTHSTNRYGPLPTDFAAKFALLDAAIGTIFIQYMRLAVVKLDAGPQLELPCRRVDRLRHFGREAGSQNPDGVADHQGVIGIVIDPPLRAILHKLRVETGRFRTDRNIDRNRCGGRGRAQRAQHHRGGPYPLHGAIPRHYNSKTWKTRILQNQSNETALTISC